MNQTEAHNELKEIRAIMERSTRFLSLSGWTGVLIGIYAIIGAIIAWRLLYDFDPYFNRATVSVSRITLIYLFLDAAVVLLMSIVTGLVLTYFKAQSTGQRLWSPAAFRLFLDLAVPLIFGALFLGILLYHGFVGIVAPGMLLFYGLGLFAAGRNTHSDIRFLGILEMILAVIALLDYGHGLFYWTLGFGVLHIVYGVWMYFRYEVRKG
ncbi:MAG TPA: hypothetical protein DDX92_10850 [Flavobacteriales bacterium]|jgi:uncharacterized Tic20 family protein|nr:hypothetical protein [Flavobacteriales bacterium]